RRGRAGLHPAFRPPPRRARGVRRTRVAGAPGTGAGRGRRGPRPLPPLRRPARGGRRAGPAHAVRRPPRPHAGFPPLSGYLAILGGPRALHGRAAVEAAAAWLAPRSPDGLAGWSSGAAT